MNEANLAARTCTLNRAVWADTDVHYNARRSHALRALGVRGGVCGGRTIDGVANWDTEVELRTSESQQTYLKIKSARRRSVLKGDPTANSETMISSRYLLKQKIGRSSRWSGRETKASRR